MTTTMKYATIDLGTIEAILNKLGGIEGAKSFLRGDIEVGIKAHIIDCDADPRIINGWSVEEHIQGGQFHWNPEAVELFLDEGQKDGVVGNELRQRLKGKKVLNACVLDYLLAHPELIPNQWKGKFVFFWGTIYRNSNGDLYVRCLYWSGFGWNWDYDWLDDRFSGSDPAAVSASN